LLRQASEEAGAAALQPALEVEIAALLRRWEGVLGARRAGALRQRIGGLEGARGMVLRGLARDASVLPIARAGLEAEAPADRAAAALTLELLGDEAASGSVARALLDEPDAEAFRRMAAAASRLGARVPMGALWERMDDLETLPEALALASLGWAEASEPMQERIGRRMRAALRHPEARIRAGAAHALARAGDRRAWRALAARLEDPVAEVREAAAHALAALAVPESRAALEAALRLETRAEAWPAYRDAITAARTGRSRGVPIGEEVLRLQVAHEGAPPGAGSVEADLILPGGRWLRMRSLQTGELLLADLCAGSADLRIRLGAGEARPGAGEAGGAPR
ncbi:MAG: HEAT repeat domain-containing protein, partial [Myxococcales bacterium]|nr:HEAT repeat domain-containing protein [Myxococcales bacterium]